ncbi:MAG: hypothetical protein U1E91_03160 [Moraxella sp.]
MINQSLHFEITGNDAARLIQACQQAAYNLPKPFNGLSPSYPPTPGKSQSQPSLPPSKSEPKNSLVQADLPQYANQT